MKLWRHAGYVTIVLTLLLSPPVKAGWQPDQSPEINSNQSPFSLEPADQAAVRKPAAADSPQPVGVSPFSLPNDEKVVAESRRSNSPFSLPAEDKKLPPEVPATVETAADLLQKGTALAREGKLEEARTALALSLEKEPENLVTLNNLGLVMRKLGRINEAVEAYQFALEIDDTYALTYKNLGVLLENNGEKQLAIQAYRQYSKLAPDAADAKNVSDRANWLEGKK